MKDPDTMVRYLKGYRFDVTPYGRDRLALSRIAWEGGDLVLSRGLTRHGDLAAEFAGTYMAIIRLYAESDGPAEIEWEVAFGDVLRRGFQELNAASADIAVESVVLLNARIRYTKRGN